MQDLPRAHLRELLRRHGLSIADDPDRVGDLLQEALGDDYRREVSLIETASEEGVPRALVGSTGHPPADFGDVVSHLARDRGLSPQAARWAVEAWAAALGIHVPSRAAVRIRAVLTLAGGAALLAASFTPWGFGHKAYRLGIDILWTKDASTRATFVRSIALVTVVLGIIAILGLIPRRGWPTTLAGIGGLAIFVLFVITHSIRAQFAGSQVQYGAVLLLASAVAIPAGFIGVRRERRTPIPTGRGAAYGATRQP